MTMTEEKHQCHSCLWGELDTPPSPGEWGTGVNCRNMLHLQWLEEQGMEGLRDEYADYGYANLFTIEEVGGDDIVCPHWNSKSEEIKDQMMPAPDEAPLTMCPWCGKEYNVREEESTDYQEVTEGIYRHVPCGHLVRYSGYSD